MRRDFGLSFAATIRSDPWAEEIASLALPPRRAAWPERWRPVPAGAVNSTPYRAEVRIPRAEFLAGLSFAEREAEEERERQARMIWAIWAWDDPDRPTRGK